MSPTSSTYPLLWQDGQPLLPQHFQQLEASCHALLSRSLHLCCPFPWGVQNLVVDSSCLPDGLFRILSADVVIPDGLVCSVGAHPSNDGAPSPSLEVDLSKSKPDSPRKTLLVWVSVPMLHPGSSPLLGASPRFRVATGFVATDYNSDENPVDIPRLIPCLHLSVGDRCPPDHSGFPLAKVAFVDGSFRLADYTPPCFSLDPVSPVMARCRRTVGNIREKVASLSEKWQNHVGTSLLRETADMLRPLFTVLPSLESLVTSTNTHPADVTRTFIAAAGVLSQLDLGTVPPRFPPYNHNDIDGSLLPVLAFIDQLLDRLSSEYAIFPFKKNEPVFSFKLNRVLCLGVPELLVGVKAKPGIQAPQIEAWMKDAIIVSDDALQKVQSKRIVGAPRHLLVGDQLAELAPPRDMTLFCVSMDPQFVVPGQYLHIFNPSDTEYERPAEIMLYVHKMGPETVDEAA